MKSYQKYIIIPLVTTILTLLYGFIIGGEMAPWFAGVLFIISLIILILFERKSSENKLFGKTIKVIVMAAVMVGLSAALYGAVNQTVYTTCNSFDAEITDFWYGSRSDTDIYFTAPDGKETYVTVDKLGTLEIGDRITIDECRGFFGEEFYRYHGIAE